MVNDIVDQFSVHKPRGRAKGTVARRELKNKLNKELNRQLDEAWHRGYSKGRREKLGNCAWCGKQLIYDGNMHQKCAQAKNRAVKEKLV